jgi:hypothetical protein
MSSASGSIANLFVTRKSLVTRNSESAFSVPFPVADDRTGGVTMQIKSRRWKGAGSGSNEIFAATGGENDCSITSGCSRKPW